MKSFPERYVNRLLAEPNPGLPGLQNHLHLQQCAELQTLAKRMESASEMSERVPTTHHANALLELWSLES
jgi:hypothetical protein